MKNKKIKKALVVGLTGIAALGASIGLVGCGPESVTGDKGDTGAAGAAGKSAFEIWRDDITVLQHEWDGVTGITTDDYYRYLANLVPTQKGDKGDTGDKGDRGNPGSDASVTDEYIEGIINRDYIKDIIENLGYEIRADFFRPEYVTYEFNSLSRPCMYIDGTTLDLHTSEITAKFFYRTESGTILSVSGEFAKDEDKLVYNSQTKKYDFDFTHQLDDFAGSENITNTIIQLTVNNDGLITYFEFELDPANKKPAEPARPVSVLTDYTSVAVADAAASALVASETALRDALDNPAVSYIEFVDDITDEQYKIQVTNNMTLDRDLTINLNGHTLISGIELSSMLDADAKKIDVTIKNGTVDSRNGGGKVNDASWLYGINFRAPKTVFNKDGSKFVINLDNIESKGYYGGFSTEGNLYNLTVNATNCKFIATGDLNKKTVGAYFPGKGDFTFIDCEFTGDSGLAIKGGNYEFTNCTFKARSTSYEEISGATSGSSGQGQTFGIEINSSYYKPAEFDAYTIKFTNCLAIDAADGEETDPETFVAYAFINKPNYTYDIIIVDGEGTETTWRLAPVDA